MPAPLVLAALLAAGVPLPPGQQVHPAAPARPLPQASPASPADLAADAGYGPWRLGMTRKQVRSYSPFGPYKVVDETGGLETANGRFADRKANISFVFDPKGKLEKIQIWAYEGKDLFEAVHAWHRVYRHLEETCGPVDVRGAAVPEHADADTFSTAVRTAVAAVPENSMLKLQMIPMNRKSSTVFSSFFRHPMFGLYVFLYYQNPTAARPPGSTRTDRMPTPRGP